MSRDGMSVDLRRARHMQEYGSAIDEGRYRNIVRADSPATPEQVRQLEAACERYGITFRIREGLTMRDAALALAEFAKRSYERKRA